MGQKNTSLYVSTKYRYLTLQPCYAILKTWNACVNNMTHYCYLYHLINKLQTQVTTFSSLSILLWFCFLKHLLRKQLASPHIQEKWNSFTGSRRVHREYKIPFIILWESVIQIKKTFFVLSIKLCWYMIQ